MTVEISPHVAEKPPEHPTINNTSSAADVAGEASIPRLLTKYSWPHSEILEHTSHLKKGEAERERQEQKSEHVRQSAQAAILPLVV